MTANLLSVLSPQQTQIYQSINNGLKIKDIAKELNTHEATIRKQLKRIKNKVSRLEEQGIQVEQPDIQELFDTESNRSLPKLTVTQAQFLASSESMACKSKRSYEMRRRLGVKPDVQVRKMTQEELEQARITMRPHKEDPLKEIQKNPKLAGYELEYRSLSEDGCTDLEYMASLEVILRAYGIIYRTPYINKLNKTTSIAMRAKEEGFNITVVKPGETKFLKQGSRFLESVKADHDEDKYSLWLVPKR
jgi:transposase